MSLSSHLENPSSEIRRFLYEQFPNTLPLVRKENKRLSAVETIRSKDSVPYLESIRPTDKIPYPYAEIGTAIDYRIRYYFDVTPNTELVAYHGAYLLTSVYSRLANQLVASFFDGLQTTLSKETTIGQRLDPDPELKLNRHCFILALFEQVRRMPPRRIDRSLLFLMGTSNSLSDLLSIPETSWLEDMCTLSWSFYENYEHEICRSIAILNPTFLGSRFIGGADADLILNSCLIDIKTTIEPRIQNRTLYQLLGYVLLDYNNEYEIDEVGIYFARQGVTLRWPLARLLDNLCRSRPRPRLAELRDQFRELVLAKGIPHRRIARVQQETRGAPLMPSEWIQ